MLARIFFPKPSGVILLEGSPMQINERKSDMGVSDINLSIAQYRNYLISAEIPFYSIDTVMNDVEVKEGNVIGIAEGKLLGAGDGVDEITSNLVEKLVDEDSAIVTLFYGEDVSEEDANKLRDELEEKFEDIDVELYYGGQPLYYYLISVE